MGDWDTYCALCATPVQMPFHAADKVGSRDPLLLAIRARIVALLRKKLRPDEVRWCSASFDEDDVAKELDEGQIDWDDEHSKYDPTLVTVENSDWQCPAQVVGLNEDGNAFISGNVYVPQHGRCHFEVGSDPNTPNKPQDEYTHSYWTLDTGHSVVFPTHEICRSILCKVLGISDAVLDRKALYESFCLLSIMFRAHLTIDYGWINGHLNDWEQRPGEEYTVTEPTTSAAALEAIKAKIKSTTRQEEPYPSFKEKHDPFRVLPTDIAYEIASYLAIHDLQAACVASVQFNAFTNNSSFWKPLLRRQLAILASVEEFDLDDISSAGAHVDYKRVCLWLDQLSMPMFGAVAPWTGAANRRRIWNCCEQVAEVYRERRPKTKVRET